MRMCECGKGPPHLENGDPIPDTRKMNPKELGEYLTECGFTSEECPHKVNCIKVGLTDCEYCDCFGMFPCPGYEYCPIREACEEATPNGFESLTRERDAKDVKEMSDKQMFEKVFSEAEQAVYEYASLEDFFAMSDARSKECDTCEYNVYRYIDDDDCFSGYSHQHCRGKGYKPMFTDAEQNPSRIVCRNHGAYIPKLPDFESMKSIDFDATL